MYEALARGLSLTRGDIVGYLNSGDTLFPWAFDVLLQIFADDAIHWATGYTSITNMGGQVVASWAPTRYRREFVVNGFYADPKYPRGIQQESTFWRSNLQSCVDMDRLSRMKLAGDYFLWTQFAQKHELHSINSPLGAFLLHANQLSEDTSSYAEEVASIIRRPTMRERFTAWWEVSCNPLLKDVLWRYTLGKSKAAIYSFDKGDSKWVAR